MASLPTLEEMLGHVAAMDAALRKCLPPGLLGDVKLSRTALNVDVKRHPEEFMDAAKKIQLFLTSVERQNPHSRDYILRQEIAALEEELKCKDDLMQRQLQLVSKWKLMLQSQKTAAIDELEKVDRTENEPPP